MAPKSYQGITTFFNKYHRACEDFCGGRVHIPKPDIKNGIPGKNILLMFINERPGRIGPGQTDSISFENPDPTAHRFRRLFGAFGISRKRIFITNACIYYPTHEKYRDKPPDKKEINFSKDILIDQIKRVKPKIIVTLGNTALYTLKKIYPRSLQLKNYQLKNNIGKLISDNKPIIYPLYHTSNRAERTRPEKKQRKDWGKLKTFIKKHRWK